METDKNLKEAFAGESQASRKYVAFSRKADKEGHKQIAKLFRAAAESETIHALKHLDVMQGIRTTKENLQEAINGETFEFTKMYPAMIEQAEKDNNSKAKLSFAGANAVEQEHAKLFSQALAALKANKDLDKADIYVCDVCGNTFMENVPDRCPVCKAPKSGFKLIE
ncbi:MAG: rubrerythrin family protein [Nanoarchaeota archaeon]|nr:rubrerythrin family protein [Nanoarchaeota archaeon]